MTPREYYLLYELAATAYATDWPDEGLDFLLMEVHRDEWESLRDWIREQRRRQRESDQLTISNGSNRRSIEPRAK